MNPGKCTRCKKEFDHLISVSDHPDFHDGDYCDVCNPWRERNEPSVRLTLKDGIKETPEVRAWLDQVGILTSAHMKKIIKTKAFTDAQTKFITETMCYGSAVMNHEDVVAVANAELAAE